MKTVEELTKEVVGDFVKCAVLFTALDVSHKVKETLPFARHREVRDVVRNIFLSDIEPASYAKTSISVTLADGSSADALLYHPLVDSWDLDNKYSAQKRTSATQAVPMVPQQVYMPVSQQVAAPAFTAPTQPANPQRVVWSQLFGSQPSLFPRK